MHQAEVALLDEVEEREARRLVLLGDRHDEPQVRLHERALGVVTLAGGAPELALLGGRELLAPAEQLLACRVALLDLLGETDLVVLGEERVLPDVGEIEADEIFLVAFDSLLRHPGILLSSWCVESQERHGARATLQASAPLARL